MVFRSVNALVAEGGEGGDEEMEKLLVGSEVFDGSVKVVIELLMEDARSYAEGFDALGEKRDFRGVIRGIGRVVGVACWVFGWVEEVIKIGVGEGGEIEGGVVLEVFDEEIEECDGAVERAGRGLDGPLFVGLGSFWSTGSCCGVVRRTVDWVGPEGIVDDFEKEEDSGEERERKGEEVVGVGGEPVFGRGSDGFDEVFEILMVEVDVLSMVGDESAGCLDVGKGGEVGGGRFDGRGRHG